MSGFAKASHVFLDVSATTVDEALEFFADKAIELGVSADRAAVLAAMKAREAEGTTGMMAGFAIPHGKSTAIDHADVLVAKFAGEVAWSSMDGEPIKVAIALLVPDNEAGTTYLRMLSQIAVELMNEDFRNKVLATDDPETIAALVNEGLHI